MANVRIGNTLYIETTGAEVGRFKVTNLVVTGDGGAGLLVLEDGALGKKAKIRIPSGETEELLLPQAWRFSDSINVTTATNIAATLTVEDIP